MLISILPITIISIYSNYRYERSIETKLGLYSEQILTEVAKNIKNELLNYETLSEEVIMDDLVQEGLSTYTGMDDFNKNKLLDDLNTKLGNEIFRFSNLKNIHLLMPDGSSFYDIGYEFFSEENKQSLIKSIDQSDRNLFHTYTKTNQNSDCILIGRKINAKEQPDKKLGYMFIVVDEKVFAEQIYKNVDMGKGSDLFIIDSSGLIISSISNGLVNGSRYPDETFVEQLNKDTKLGSYTRLQKNIKEKFMAVSTYIPEADWYLVGRIPDSYINSESLEVRNGIILLCIIVVILSVLLSMFIYLSVYAPIRDIVVSAKRIGDGELDVVIDDGRNDEMSSLSRNIRRMVSKLKELIDNIKKEQTAKREAELKMLQAQINPHFLFNTLNSLKWTAMLSNNNTLSDGLEALSGLMKDTILNKDELVDIETEINNLKNYATIQRIRYGCSFSLLYDIEEALKKCLVLKFILQPIVENSILHGIEDENSMIEIRVHVSKRDECLHITVEDNGKGFDTAETDFARKNKKLSGIGITNVDERIKINYGDDFGLKVESRPGLGTSAFIRLPYLGGRD
jgi:two-component system sensor histidine kinase YesM